MKKIFLLIPLILLITGCRVKSNITINKDLTVKETINMTETSEYFNNRYKELPLTVIKSLLTSGKREETLIQNGYKYEFSNLEKTPSVLATKEYSSLEDFAKGTIFKNQFYDDIIITNNNNIISFKTSGIVPYDEENTELYDVEKCSITITLPFVVTSHNADNHDKKTNSYTWNFLDNNPREIELTFDKNKIYIYNIYMYISMFILFLIVVIIIIIILKMRKKNKINNKFGEWEES